MFNFLLFLCFGGEFNFLIYTFSELFHLQIVFSRPIRWILALHGDSVVPFSFAGISRYYILCSLQVILVINSL